MLVLTLVVVAAYFRAEYKLEREKGESIGDTLIVSLGPTFIYFLFILVPALFLPNWFGLAGAAIGLVVVCLVFFWAENEGREYPSRETIAQELVGVLIVFMLLVVSNYTVFQ